jgi:chemotaxis protein histidine kinase CheA
MSNFNAAVFVSEQLNRMIINAAQELAQRAVTECANKYDFDAIEAIKLLGLQNIKVERNRPEKATKAPKEKVVKAAFPMPYTGVCVAGCCSALRQNQGLYTQCTGSLKKNAVFCKQCQINADKNGGVPEYGTIAMRQAVGLYDYVDPKGRKPVSFTKIMKKYKIDQAGAIEEAAKFGIVIAEEHFVVPEVDKKKGRPKAEKAPKEKGAKGRPKKAKKMLQIEGDDDDLFASLVADANANTSAEPEKKKRGKSDEEKAAEEAKKKAEKEEKEAKRLAEKAEKEAKLAAEKAAKELKAAEEKAAREFKKQKEEQEKAEKKAAAELAKKEKEEKLAAEKAEKEAKKASKKPAEKPTEVAEPEPDQEPDVVKKIEFEGKKYLKSKKTGIVYDYNMYVKEGEQVVVGKWNDDKNKIDFNKASDEESEEEYAM